MNAKIVSGALLVVALIHFLPLRGVLGPEHLAALYGVPIDGANLEILMRHRAALFGLLGALLVYAAFKPSLQPMAILAGLISVVSFIVLAWGVGGYSQPIATVVIADVVALACLLVAIGLRAYGSKRA